MFFVIFFIGFITFYIAGNSSLLRKEYFWATIQLIMSSALSISMLLTIRFYPVLWGYNANKKYIDKLKGFKSS